jgi:hypothetical protein
MPAKISLSAIGLLCFSALLVSYPKAVLADQAWKDCEQPTKTHLLDRPANNYLPLRKLKPKAFFTKNLSPDAVVKSFEIIPYSRYLKKYPGAMMCDISLNRMVTVLIVDLPKGFTGDHAEYSSGSVMSIMDALTGEVIASETTGTVSKSFGPSAIFPEVK